MNQTFIISFILLFPLSLLILLYTITRPRPIKIPIKNRHVFITGGSSGIGLALAHRFASEGSRVSILARDQRKLDDAKQAIRRSTGVDVATFSADVRDFEAVNVAVEAAGPIDVLICNHGVFIAQELEKQSLEMVKLMIDVNLMGTFNLIKAALPFMKIQRQDRGPRSIAIMSSQAGQVGIYGYTAYSATKFGLRGLAETLQQEVIEDNIHVSLICPPYTDTPGLDKDNITKPKLTTILTSSRSMSADEVAKKTIDGIKNGRFIIPCNFGGALLSIVTAGFSTQRSYLMAFIEVFFAGVGRFISLFILWSLYGKINKWHSQNK